MKKLSFGKRVAAVALCAAITALTLAGCDGGGAEAETSGTPSASVSPSPSPSPSPTPPAADESTDAVAPEEGGGEPDFGAARATLPADTVMMTVNGEQILWDEFFFSIYANISNVISYFGDLPAWDEQIMEGVTLRSYVDDAVFNEMVSGRAVKIGARVLGLSLTDEDAAQIDAQFANMEEQLGGAEGLREYLNGMYCSEELYRMIVETSYMQKLCFDEMYGEGGEKVSDSDIQRYAEDSGYLMAKHILKLTEDAATREPLTDDEIAKAREETEGILAQLNGYVGEDFEGFFDDLMFENSEDPGLAGSPDGYLFGAGEMVPEFENATRQLTVGSHSGIVETDYGFHIIYRVPIDYDAVLGSGYTLRYTAARDIFDRTAMTTWIGELDIELSDAYDALDIASIF
jgi:hypothetical protein